ncbi:hypothetical protein [Halorussus aquaticus]|uniref:hypothetical protein n=1 Tax=Halorussus aquaticus TaxID=2953748 RepID=UPI0020B6FBAE|nr:hypothetical protein [Halorussus aquaticus]
MQRLDDRQRLGLRPRAENVVRDPEFVTLRDSDADALAWVPSEGTTASDGDESSTPSATHRERRLVATAEAADRLRFADVEGADDARQFVAETDFESQTLFLERHRVRECFRLKLCYITWSETEVGTRYGRYYRDADVACRTDAEDATVRLIRVPDALDPERVSGYSSGTNSNGCRYPPSLRTTTEQSRSGSGSNASSPSARTNRTGTPTNSRKPTRTESKSGQSATTRTRTEADR